MFSGEYFVAQDFQEQIEFSGGYEDAQDFHYQILFSGEDETTLVIQNQILISGAYVAAQDFQHQILFSGGSEASQVFHNQNLFSFFSWQVLEPIEENTSTIGALSEAQDAGPILEISLSKAQFATAKELMASRKLFSKSQLWEKELLKKLLMLVHPMQSLLQLNMGFCFYGTENKSRGYSFLQCFQLLESFTRELYALS